MTKLSRQIRNMVFVLIVVALSFACTIELLQIQIVDGDYYKMESAFLKACSELGLTIEKETV